MKRFSQFLGIFQGKNRFKQAPVATICYQCHCQDDKYGGCTKYTIVVTGDETFNFQSANNTVYYKNNDFINIPHDAIVYATCTHFTWGSGAVIADMKDGQFIFNYTKSTGIGTGNISFKKDDLFTSASDAKTWLKEQVTNGTPVTITVYIKSSE